MIKNHDRSKWFGASDTYTIMCASTDSMSFCRWWAVKLGLIKHNITTPAMAAGTFFEHRILDAYGIKKRDRQIKMRKYRLRVNLDGETEDEIIEVKTHSADKPFKLSKAYWMQAQVEMFATGKKLKILSYALNEDDYDNFYNPIELERGLFHPVEYDAQWINEVYLPRLIYFSKCLCGRIKPR